MKTNNRTTLKPGSAACWQNYRTSLQVPDAKIIAMVDDPNLRGGKILHVSVASHAYWIVVDRPAMADG